VIYLYILLSIPDLSSEGWGFFLPINQEKNMRKLHFLLCLLLLGILSTMVEAEDDVIKLDEIIISATRTTSTLDKISASSSVISEEQINY
jgi:hypothetical protein